MSEGNGRQTGLVKWYNGEKGYGFISVPGGEMDVFIHSKQLRDCGIHRNLVEGEQVEFTLALGPKGRFATGVSILGK